LLGGYSGSGCLGYPQSRPGWMDLVSFSRVSDCSVVCHALADVAGFVFLWRRAGLGAGDGIASGVVMSAIRRADDQRRRWSGRDCFRHWPLLSDRHLGDRSCGAVSGIELKQDQRSR